MIGDNLMNLYLFSKVYPNQNSPLLEVTSKAPPLDEEVNDSVKSLTEKLSSALLNISAKEDLVKQHAKVAEEAVSGIICSFRHYQLQFYITLRNNLMWMINLLV